MNVYLSKLAEKKDAICVGLLLASGVCVVLLLIKVTGFFVTSARAETLVRRAAVQNKVDVNDTAKHLQKYVAAAEDLKKKNLFAPPEPKRNPISEVVGIIGSEAIINGELHKVGDKIGDAEIVAIEPTRVKVRWDGREHVFAPFEQAVGGPGDRGPGRPSMQGPPSQAERGNGGPQVVVVQGGMPGFGMGFSPEDRERFMMMRDRFQNMSPEERERLRSQMRDRSGGGDRGGGDRGGRGERGGR
jgi:uncharacterized membrane protein YgcG